MEYVFQISTVPNGTCYWEGMFTQEFFLGYFHMSLTGPETWADPNHTFCNRVTDFGLRVTNLRITVFLFLQGCDQFVEFF